MQDLNDVLKKIVNGGWVPIILYLLLGIIGIPCGMQNLGMVFFGASMDHYCQVPGLEDFDPKDAQKISATIDKKGELSSCEVYDLDYNKYSADELRSWNRTLMLANVTETRECDSWFYDRSEFLSSARSRWDLVCTEYDFKLMMQSVYMCGFLVGTVSFGVLSDRIGRLKAFMLSLILHIGMALVAALISVYWHWIAFTIVRFLVAMATAGLFTVPFVLIVELQAPKWRTFTGIFYQGFFALGFCLLPAIAYGLRDFLKIQLAMAIPPAILISYYWFIPESPRWLIQQGRHEEADSILKKMARLNNRPLPESFSTRDLTNEKGSESQKTLLDIIRMPRQRIRLLICAFCWFVCGMAYYGISNSADRLPGDIFVTTMISAVVELPAYVIVILVITSPRIGRRVTMSAGFIITGLSLCACIPLLNSESQAAGYGLVVLANIGKLGISASFAIAYVFTAEIFPTVTRATCVGSCSMCARVGALLESQIMQLWTVWYGIPYILFGLLALLGGVFALFLPESTNEVLPETVEDGEAFGTKEYRRRQEGRDSSEGNMNGDEMKQLKDSDDDKC